MKPFSPFRRTAVLSLLAAVAGGALGWAFRPDVENPDNPARATPPPQTPLSLVRSSSQNRAQDRIDAVHRAGPPSAQCLAVLAFAEIETVAEIRELLEKSRFLPPHAAPSLAIQTLLRRWLELEPEEAMEHCRAHYLTHLPDLLVKFAATHPVEAGRLAAIIPSGYWSGIAWQNVCLGVATRDPEAAWAMLQRTPKNAEHETGRAAGKLAALDPAGAAARIEKLPESIRGYARGAFAWDRMQADPAAGWAWILRQPDPAYLIQHTVGETLRRDPEQAFALLASLSPEHLASVRDKWRLNFNLYDIAGTSSALAASALEPEVKQILADQFLFAAQQRDPAQAASLFAQLSPATQVEKAAVFLNHWTARDPAAAQAWREALPPGPVRDAAGMAAETASANRSNDADPPGGKATGTLAHDVLLKGYISSNDPRLTTLSPQGFGEIMDAVSERTQDSYISLLAEQNPDAVTGWLEKSGQITNLTGPHLAHFFVEWSSHSLTEAAAWTLRQPEGEIASTAAVNVARQYQRYDPAGARAWVDSLPAGPVRDAGARGLEKW